MSNKPIFLAAIFIVFLVGLISCGSTENQSNQKLLDAENEVEVSDLNPNGDSDLALLMRKLFEDADSIKALVQSGQGNISDDYIQAIELTHSATPTDPDVQDEQYHAMNKMLLVEANRLLNAEDAHVDKFNAMVGRCIDCHNTLCPGPITRIKKLYIK